MNILRKMQNIITGIGNRNYGKVGIIGVPFEKGQHKEGVAHGPKVIRAAGLVQELELLGLNVRDYGNILYKAKNVDVNNMSHLGDIAGCTSCLSEQVQQVLKEDRRVLTIGGDHSLGIGTIDGHVKV
ncbi:Arginase-1, partial [Eufriesea mexicana]